MAPTNLHDAWCIAVLDVPFSYFPEANDAPGEVSPALAAASSAAQPPVSDEPGNRKVTDGKAAPKDARTSKDSVASAREAIKFQDWGKAATALAAAGESAMLKVIRSLPKPSIKKLHEAAIADISIGQNAPLALATASIDEAPVGGKAIG